MIDNPRAAKVSVFGDWGSAEDIVYDNWEESDFDIPALKARTDVKFAFGLDFGYKVSYNAFVAIAYEPMTRTMWIYDEMYEKGMTNLDIAKKIISIGYGKEKIWADAAEPKSIYELREGLIEERKNSDGTKDYVRYALPNIIEAVKGPDSVSNGISRVQEYHIYVHYKCRNCILEFNNYAYARDKDGNFTGKPEKEFDHCLVAGTMILTDHGEIPIENVSVGDMVMTHLGYRPVMASGITQFDQPIWRLELTDGSILEGTWNHPIVTDTGVKYLKDVSSSDRVIICTRREKTPTQNMSNTMGCYGIDIQTLLSVANACTSYGIMSDCTDMSGKNTTVQSLRDITSTTSMATQGTMISQISYLSHLKNTIQSTLCQRIKKKGHARFSWPNRTRPKHGMLLQRGINGIRTMWEIIFGQSNNSDANNAGGSSQLNTTGSIAFAHPPARQNGVVTPDSITRSEYVRSVVSSSQSTNIAGQNAVPVAVRAVYMAGRRENVYDLTVEEAHDFFANGILTLNCMDALRYAMVGELIKGHGGVSEARGEEMEVKATTRSVYVPGEPIQVSTEPVNTINSRGIISAEGPTDVAPPKKKVVRVFSSIRYDE